MSTTSTTSHVSVRHPSFAEALPFWLKLGFISFGGPTGQIATILVAVASVAHFATASETEPGSFIRASRVDQAPRLDGVLDDACWQTAEAMTNFTQVLPVAGATLASLLGVLWLTSAFWYFTNVRFGL